MSTGAPVHLARARDLDLPALARVADGAPLIVERALLERVEAARARMLAHLAEAPGGVYGVSTGMGYLAGVALSHEEQAVHQRNLLLGRAVGSPPWLPRQEARALMGARLVNLLSGHAGVSAGLCRFLVARLNDGFVPAVPRDGGGASGEVIPLAHAFQTLLGVGRVLGAEGEAEPAAEALAARGVPPYEPGPKEGIALLAGAPAAVAMGLGRLRAGEALSRQLLVGAACSIEALRAPLDPYDLAVGRLASDPRLAEVLARLGELLQGATARGGRQAPVSFRVVPQALAHLERTLARLRRDLSRALTAVTDSPAFVDGRFISTGGFHSIGLSAALDALATGLAHAAELSAQRTHRLLDSRFSGLPDQLSPRPGPRAGLVVVHKRMAGAVRELRRLAAPALLGAGDTSLGQEDAQAFALEGAERLRAMEALVREVLAGELMCARQAWWLRGEAPAPGLSATAAVLSDAIAPVDEDRPLGDDLDRLLALLAADALTGSRDGGSAGGTSSG